MYTRYARFRRYVRPYGFRKTIGKKFYRVPRYNHFSNSFGQRSYVKFTHIFNESSGTLMLRKQGAGELLSTNLMVDPVYDYGNSDIVKTYAKQYKNFKIARVRMVLYDFNIRNTTATISPKATEQQKQAVKDLCDGEVNYKENFTNTSVLDIRTTKPSIKCLYFYNHMPILNTDTVNVLEANWKLNDKAKVRKIGPKSRFIVDYYPKMNTPADSVKIEDSATIGKTSWYQKCDNSRTILQISPMVENEIQKNANIYSSDRIVYRQKVFVTFKFFGSYAQSHS